VTLYDLRELLTPNKNNYPPLKQGLRKATNRYSAVREMSHYGTGSFIAGTISKNWTTKLVPYGAR
jgi:hypothetical protein